MHGIARPLATTGLAVAVALAAWALLAWMALDMGHPLVQLTMPGAPDWSPANVAAIFAMWSVMMAAMMLPSALPMLLAFARMEEQPGQAGRARAFEAAYLAVWVGFSALATGLQWVLQWMDWVDPMIVSTSKELNAGLLLIAGAYQFSPLKRVCLARCRTPAAFLVGEWRPHVRGAWVMGLRHGAMCVGCCWALMALLFVGGVMNIAWVAALAVAVAVEKMVPGGERVAMVLGLALIAGGLSRMFFS
ncbi:DUF2182 domain-containing protein [Ramlibacter cellulosilyticus]|nr:DUF2182 domain-containing protein [Ramlibacter cellulosilyticus]